VTRASFESLYELMATQRAVRHFDDRPVDDASIEKVLWAATRAPSARNLQPWRFLVVRDAAVKRRLGAIFDEIGAALPGGPPERMPWGQVPVLIVVFSEYAFGRSEGGVAALGASVYPAVQNLLLAAHALGLGTVMTTRWKAREPEVREVLGLPDAMAIHAIVPIGHPDRSYGRGRRLPVGRLAFRESLDRPW
jgi:nitroreductase